jgi:energy-coupling factor transport system permease protein
VIQRHSRLIDRAYPFTVPTVTLAVTMLAFLVPAPYGPLLLYGAVILAATASGAWRAIPRGALVCLPLWFFLMVLHGFMGAAPYLEVGPLRLSVEGSQVALAQAGRFGAIVTATFAMYQGFRPSSFIDAVAERGWSFQAAYLLVATLGAIPRLAAQGAAIQQAQRARGLRVRGGLRQRLTGLRALSLPLLFGALAEVEDRTLALETRCVPLPIARLLTHHQTRRSTGSLDGRPCWP